MQQKVAPNSGSNLKGDEHTEYGPSCCIHFCQGEGGGEEREEKGGETRQMTVRQIPPESLLEPLTMIDNGILCPLSQEWGREEETGCNADNYNVGRVTDREDCPLSLT